MVRVRIAQCNIQRGGRPHNRPMSALGWHMLLALEGIGDRKFAPTNSGVEACRGARD